MAKLLSALLGLRFHLSLSWTAFAPRTRTRCWRSFSPNHQIFQVIATESLPPSAEQGWNTSAENKTLIFFIMPCSHLMYSQEITMFTIEKKKNQINTLFRSFGEDYSLRTAPASSFKSMWSVWLKVSFGESNSIDQKLEVRVKGACLFEVYPAGFWFISSK